tara:strand:- start:1441 stop:2031 length:591 start_codon:yes stop_codon:yes gene_type:complete
VNDMSRIEDEVCEKIKARSDVGKKKYGVTMEREDLDLVSWLTHLQEELMDAAVYTQRLLNDISVLETETKSRCAKPTPPVREAFVHLLNGLNEQAGAEFTNYVNLHVLIGYLVETHCVSIKDAMEMFESEKHNYMVKESKGITKITGVYQYRNEYTVKKIRDKDRCTGITKIGTRCQSYAKESDNFKCFQHRGDSE